MKRKSPALATDIIIEYEEGGKSGLVLIERKFFPYGIAIPGGHAEFGLSLKDNAIKEALEETGLDVRIRKLFNEYSNPKRDPRTHVVSIVYIGEGNGKIKAGDDAKSARFYPFEEIFSLLGKDVFAFDHKGILSDYLQHKNIRGGD